MFVLRGSGGTVGGETAIWRGLAAVCSRAGGAWDEVMGGVGVGGMGIHCARAGLGIGAEVRRHG